MSDGSGFPGFHSHSYDRNYSRPLFRVASFSDSGDEQERHAASPRGHSQSMSRTASYKGAAPSRLSPSMSKMSMKKLQQVVDEKSMEDEGKWSVACFPDVSLRYFLIELDDFCSEMELMKEKYTKLLLGEDMSGSGKGVCTAVAITNAITNLYGIYL